MRMTKGMKKALSFVLAGAMVITGANFGTTKTASAATEATKTDVTSYSVTFDFEGTKTPSNFKWAGSTVAGFNGNGTYTVQSTAENNIGSGYIQNLGFWKSDKADAGWKIKNIKLTINGIEFTYPEATLTSAVEKNNDGSEKDTAGVDMYNAWSGKTGTVMTAADGSELKYVAYTADMGSKDGWNGWGVGTYALYKAAGSGSGSSTSGAAGSGSSSGSASPGMTGFNVGFNYVSDDVWSEQDWATKSVEVTGNGDYDLSYTAQGDTDDIFMMILSTDLNNGSVAEGFELTPTKITIGGTEVAITPNKQCWGFSDNNAEKPYRYNIRNPYNALYEDNGIQGVANTVADIFDGQYVKVKAGDEIVVSFNVKGMDPSAKKIEVTPFEATSVPTAAIHPSDDNGNGGGGDVVVNTNATLKLDKSSVMVAAGKSVTVKATTNQSKISATAKDSKIAGAKVSGKNVTITAPKNATKGASTTVTVQAGTKKATVKVTVKNPAKKIKAAKKTVTVKKGKKATLKFKVTATNKKKAAVDTIKVTSKNKKVAKVTKYSVKKGKATVTVKGVKKGKKTTVTLKIGKKSAKVTVKVK